MASAVVLLNPLRRATFRRLWIGMSLSYGGDRLQELAQAWLVALLTHSAIAVGGISVLASLPQLLMPLGGVIADQVDRRKLLIVTQLLGALLSLAVGIVVLSGFAAAWHIYAWAIVAGTIWLFARPAYKVVLTEAVPSEEVRAASSLNSITETLAMVVVNSGGSIVLGLLGLPLAFMLNATSYMAGAWCLWTMKVASQPSAPGSNGWSIRRLFVDLKAGLVYLMHQPRLLHPLLLTFSIMVAIAPASGLLAAVVQKQGGTVVSLGLLAAAGSLGTLAGAIYAGMYKEGENPVRTYALYAIAAGTSLAAFAFLPVGYLTVIPMMMMGFIMFSQAVWNTSRVRLLADAVYQARLQAIGSMAFTIGGALGQVWGGLAVDRFGTPALAGGGLVLVVLAAVILGGIKRET